ncbi:protein phosphatase 1E [Achlya hypogyna]|uniref:Protein phosphatase 1E n=1 Tax=Achlya hypogyna TaxID=1202772 RepID=A0A1V9YM90_ACHHY|nr:protein phosphatase 1E [Achlya hypogyna]
MEWHDTATETTDPWGGGGGLMSSSYVAPRPWEWDQFSLLACKQGYLEKQSVKDKSLWKSRWVVLDGNVVIIYKSEDAVPPGSPPPFGRQYEKSIPLDSIASIGTAKDFGPAAFHIKLHEEHRTYVFRADSKDHMNDWLFKFQCCIANLISEILRYRRDGRPRLSSSFSRHVDMTRRQHRSQSFDFREMSRYDGAVTLQQLTQHTLRHSTDSNSSSSQVRSPLGGTLFPLEDLDMEVAVDDTIVLELSVEPAGVPPPAAPSASIAITPTAAPVPELAQCVSPPTVPKKKYIPPHLRHGYTPEPAMPPAMPELPPNGPADYRELRGTSNKEGTLVYGATSLLGKRSRLEDVIVCLSEYGRPHQALYALFDGHDGDEAAQYAKEKLPLYLHEHEHFEDDWRRACRDVFHRLDEEFLKSAKPTAGTTASVVVLRGKKLLTANAGDSKAVISIAGQALEIIAQQTPGRPDEMERIVAAGGWVHMDRELHMSKLHQMDLKDPYIQEKAKRVVKIMEIHRVNGDLSVSRAIGDIEYKRPNNYTHWQFPDDHSRHFTAALLIPDPEFQEYEITPEMEFVVLACDGLWDTIDNQEAVDIVRAKLRAGWTMEDISYHLAELAIRSGSMDNVTVVVVVLNPLTDLK